MASEKKPVPMRAESSKPLPDPSVCYRCGGAALRGDFSSVANFGVTREPHFVTSYGWMQVRYDRATPIDAWMCLKCGHIDFYGRTPMSVLDPIERQDELRKENPELDRSMRREEKRRKELEDKGKPLSGDDHTGV